MKNYKLIIPIHSFIDVVTNSSTSIYVGCHGNTIQYAKDLIDELIKATGLEKKADDLFNFVISVDYDTEEDTIMDKLDEFHTEEELENADYEDKRKMARIIFDKVLKGEIEEYEGFGESEDCDLRKLIITSKSGDVNINLTERMEKIFSIEESSN